MADKELLFVPLGGAGEIGMNLSLYGCGDDWVMVDCGVTFSDERYPGLEVFVPDVTFIKEEVENLHGIIITHAHEDHIGAVAHLWRYLQCPVYVTPFAAGLLRRKLSEAGLLDRLPVTEVPCGGGADVGPFSFDYIPLAHSIPETQAVALKTPVGTILHVTDWKLDPEPLLGPCTDEKRLRAAGENGLIAMMCDSTNIFVDGHTGSEGPLRKSLTDVVAGCSKRVVVACFASNVARVLTCVHAGQQTGRQIGLVGRSLWRMTENARDCGYMEGVPDFLPPDEIGYLPRERVLLLATGSQGEPRAALARIAADSHRDIVLEEGDTVIFSSKEIPGNERAIGRIQNQLSALGVNILTDRDGFLHVSGHPARDEVATLYDWVKPPLLVPVHGETRHLTEQVAFAKAKGIPEAAMATNGSVLRLYPGPAEIVDYVAHGRLALDGNRLVPVDSEGLRTRRKMGHSGLAVATLVLDRRGEIRADPEFSLLGIDYDEDAADDLYDDVLDEMLDAVDALRGGARANDDNVREVASRAIRRVIREELGARPVIQVHVVRV